MTKYCSSERDENGISPQNQRITSLVNGTMLTFIRHLVKYAADWADDRLKYGIEISIARSAQLQQIGYWVDLMFRSYLPIIEMKVREFQWTTPDIDYEEIDGGIANYNKYDTAMAYECYRKHWDDTQRWLYDRYKARQALKVAKAAVAQQAYNNRNAPLRNQGQQGRGTYHF